MHPSETQWPPFYMFRGSFSYTGGQEWEHSRTSQEVLNSNTERNEEEKEKDRQRLKNTVVVVRNDISKN